MTELAYVSATELARLIRNKEVSPVEIVNQLLARIEAINPQINAFCTVAAEQARAEAQKAEEKVMGGEEMGPLHGVPIAIKDLTSTAGIRTTHGSLVFKDNVPEEDAIIVKRIKKAGAIILGKTNTPEFGHKGTTDNLLFGTTKNPWNLDMTSGGSSGGSAAAVASGLVPFAEGSDGGGSIRIPSCFCGVFGFKPTYGRIPFDGYPQNMFWSQAPFLHYGPISRTVEDAALLFSVMAGYHPQDPYSLPDTGEDYLQEMRADIKDLRVAYSPDLGFYQVDERVRQIIEKAVKQLESLGVQVDQIPVDLGSKKAFEEAFNTMWYAQIASAYADLLPEKREQFCRAIVFMLETGQALNALDYKKTELVRTDLWYRLQRIFENYDLLVCPTLAVPAFSHQIRGPKEINGVKVSPFTDWMLTNAFNMTGHPAASLPVGFTDDNLPVGMQIIGRRLEDRVVLRLSYAYQQAFPRSERPF
ncbi:MAG: amidase [Syntrophomonadales bacterium]